MRLSTNLNQAGTPPPRGSPGKLFGRRAALVAAATLPVVTATAATVTAHAGTRTLDGSCGRAQLTAQPDQYLVVLNSKLGPMAFVQFWVDAKGGAGGSHMGWGFPHRSTFNEWGPINASGASRMELTGLMRTESDVWCSIGPVDAPVSR